MLTAEQIETNKLRFLELVESIEREDANIEGLVKWLTEKSDFFTAPASVRYHSSFEGGLCLHSLNVYDNLIKLVKDFASTTTVIEELDEEGNVEFAYHKDIPNYSEDTLKIVALFHDISKANFYKLGIRNVKNEITGKWEQVNRYEVKSPSERFIYGNHEQNSEFMITSFIPLSVEEATSILHHHAGMSWDSTQMDVSVVYNKYALAPLLHMADMIACYIDEKI